jgi:hypothetical protein
LAQFRATADHEYLYCQRRPLWCLSDTTSPNEELDSQVYMSLWMPASAHQQAKAAADRERRSLNNMLVVLIERGLDHEAHQKEGSG